MDFYRFIIKQYKRNLREGGFFLFEIGYDQEQSITDAATTEGMLCRVYRDMSGNPRVAMIQIDNQMSESIH
jgi:methylase of polypeptide subunit release factors